MTDFPVSGGCQCGTVRYTLHAPVNEVYHCHCSVCRKVHGALFATFALVAREKLTIDQGANNLATFETSPGSHRHFCRTCGCHLFGDSPDAPDLRWFTPATLDGGAHPGHPADTERHIYAGSKVPWYEITDDLPKFEEEQ